MTTGGRGSGPGIDTETETDTGSGGNGRLRTGAPEDVDAGAAGPAGLVGPADPAAALVATGVPLAAAPATELASRGAVEVGD
jgi:hypothetical protein